MIGASSGGRPAEEQTLKNKSQKVGVFFEAEKVAAKTPHSPCKTPRLHHQKTTSKTHISLKSPAKTPLHHRFKNYRSG
jgi:hypothetical protein